MSVKKWEKLGANRYRLLENVCPVGVRVYVELVTSHPERWTPVVVVPSQKLSKKLVYSPNGGKAGKIRKWGLAIAKQKALSLARKTSDSLKEVEA